MSEIGGDDGGIATRDDPLALFDVWMEEAKKTEPDDANAMAIATADAQGHPNIRMVLLKGVDHRGFVFYTNTESAKGRELTDNPNIALCFHWKSLRRQIRVRGSVARVSDAEADAYFATRAKDSQIGAWASAQSRPMEGRFAFEKRDREIRGEICARQSPASAVLERFPRDAAPNRILARQAVPPARPACLSPRRCQQRRGDRTPFPR